MESELDSVLLLVVSFFESFDLFAGGWRKLHFIAHARIPILKFETIHNISCDISISNLSGQMKSKLLFWINEIDGRFRDVVLLACFQN